MFNVAVTLKKPDEESAHERKQTMLLWIVAIGFLMQTLDTTIVNTALPSMAESMGEELLNMYSVVFSYALMMAVMIPASGWLADRFGTQKVFLFAICFFVLGSLCCAMSGSLSGLVCSRVLQGFGGSMLLPVGRLAVLRRFPGESFLPAMSFVVIPGLIGPLLGPTLGGLLCEYFSWRWIFLINIPVGILGVAATVLYMPNDRSADLDRFDVIGYALLATAMLLCSIALSGIDMGLPYAEAGILALGGTIAFCEYVRYARVAQKPLFRLSLFRIHSFSAGLCGNMFARIGTGAMSYLLPLMMQANLGYSPVQTGLTLLPSTIAGMLVKQFAQYAIRRYGYRSVLVHNTVLVGVTIALFFFVTGTTPSLLIYAMLFFFGGVNSIQFAAMNALTLKDLPQEEASGGNSMLSMVQMLAMSTSVVVASVALDMLRQTLGPDNLSVAFDYVFVLMGMITILAAGIFRRA
jgi:EmrB/QacA subfamily drug resistance transporter